MYEKEEEEECRFAGVKHRVNACSLMNQCKSSELVQSKCEGEYPTKDQ